MASGNEMCFLRVSKPEIDLPSGTDLYAPEVYQKGEGELNVVSRKEVYQKRIQKKECIYTCRK
jgi:uncharacterized protein (DUF1015 family)